MTAVATVRSREPMQIEPMLPALIVPSTEITPVAKLEEWRSPG